MAADMLAQVPEETPDVVRRQVLAAVHTRLLPNDPSYELQAEIAAQHLASVAELGGPNASYLTEDPGTTRSAVMLSGAPSRDSRASWTQYQKFTNVSMGSIQRHVDQRDADDEGACS